MGIIISIAIVLGRGMQSDRIWHLAIVNHLLSLENACHTWVPWRCIHDKALYKSTFTFTLPYLT